MKKGFTLIEMIVYIALLAILMAGLFGSAGMINTSAFHLLFLTTYVENE